MPDYSDVSLGDLQLTVERQQRKVSRLRDQLILQARCPALDIVGLDDLAAERSTDWAADTLYRIVNARYEILRATIITANVGMDALRDRVGERVVSRLWERSVVLDLSGQDYRAKLRGK